MYVFMFSSFILQATNRETKTKKTQTKNKKTQSEEQIKKHSLYKKAYSFA